MKWNILRCLVQIGCEVTVVPGTASADEVLACKPDGIFLSNGPGDPEPLAYAIDNDPRADRQESRSSASAWAISCSAWPWAPRRSSSSSAIAAPISRC